MATSDILGLFMSPEQYQAQQLAQQQADERARAINFANLDPRGQANYGVFLGAQQLGRGFAGLLGVQDPQLQRIRQRQEIMQTINPADPESLMAGIQRASQMNDQELALTLADYTRKARGDLALAEQREREKVPEAIQIAEEIRKLTVQRDALPEGVQRNALDAQIKRLQLAQKATGSTETAEYKNAFQLTVSENPALATDSEAFKQKLSSNYNKLLFKDKADKTTELKDLLEQRKVAVREFGVTSYAVQSIDRLIDSIAPLKGTSDTKTEAVRTAEAFADVMNPDRNSTEWKDAFKSQLAKKDDTPKQFESDFIADRIVELRKKIRGAKDPTASEILEAKDKLSVLESQIKKDKPNLTVVGEVRSGLDKGKTVYVDENKDQQFIYSADSTGKQVRKLISDADVSRLTSQITATASSSGSLTEKTIVKGVAELDVEDLKTARANKKAASASNDSLRQLLSLSDQGLISGSFASGRVGATNLLNTLGILNKTSADNLSRSEQYQKIGADLVFNALQGKLGPGVSEGDRVFITELFPKLENSAAARRELIRYVAEKNNNIISEADAVEAYIRKNPDKGLSGFKSLNSGAFHVPSNKIDLSTMSPQDLKALEQKLLRDKKGGRQ
jgi:hypothetical protein